MVAKVQIEHPAFLFISLPIAAAFLLAVQPEIKLSVDAPLTTSSLFLSVSLVVCAISMVSLASISRWLKWTGGQPSILLCIFLLIVGQGLYAFQVYAYPDLTYLTVISAVLVGTGGSLLMLLWGKALSTLPGRALIVNISSAFIIAGALDIIVRMFLNMLDMTMVAVLFVLISTLPLNHLFIQEAASDYAIYDVFPQRKRVFAAIAKPFLGVASGLVVIACTWGSSIDIFGFYSDLLPFFWLMVGVSTGGVLLLVVSVFFSENARYPLLIGAGPTVAAILLVFAWISWLLTPSLTFLSEFLFGVSFSLVGILTLRAMGEISHEHGAPFAVFGETAAALFGITIVVVGISLLSTFACDIITSAIILGYLVVASLSFGRKGFELDTISELVDGKGYIPDSVFDGLQKSGNLTPAERDILPYLAHGYGSDYISNALSVSFDTVQKRTRSIYDKLGVRTRGELITLVMRRVK